MQLIIYFFVGLAIEFLVTLHLRFVAKEKALMASTFAFLSTAAGWLVFLDIISRFQEQKSVIAIIVFGLGIAIGTFFAVKLKITEPK